MADQNQLDRTAQLLIVETAPPAYGNAFSPVYDCQVTEITINAGARPSVAKLVFPDTGWDESTGLARGDRIRVSTDSGDVIFSGLITSTCSSYCGGGHRGDAFETNAIICHDHRWLLARTSPVYGQVVRSQDDYINYPSDPRDGKFTPLTGRRTIFNQNGRPNRDPDDLVMLTTDGKVFGQVPIFASPAAAGYWSAGQMINHLLSPLYNRAYEQFPIPDPTTLTGMDHEDLETILKHIDVDCKNVLDAVAYICDQLGWSFREEYPDGNATLVFYKVNTIDGSTTLWQDLYAPPVDAPITEAVAAGVKLLWSMDMAADIDAVINNPWGLGQPHRFEITAELVPAWEDQYFTLDESDDYANLFFAEADLNAMADKDSRDYFKYYHVRGSQFKRDVARKWALNESGRYADTLTYNRGELFDFTTVIPANWIYDSSGRRTYGPFDRQLLPCLTHDKDTLNSVGIKVEFSFDGGSTWQTIPATIESLTSEAGIYISEPNLAEMVDINEATIASGDLAGKQLNYFSSLADDLVNDRAFADWKTKLRVTASIEMDQRLARWSDKSSNDSPFAQAAIYDLSERYGIFQRTASSTFSNSDLPAWNVNATATFDKHLAMIRAANEDMSISGQFTFDRMWLTEFAIGDGIRLTGRRGNAPRNTNPEIIQIIHNPLQQKTTLITRDSRFTATGPENINKAR